VATFERSKLDWSELEAEAHVELLAWHRQLVAFRRSHPELAGGGVGVDVEVDEARGRLRVRRGAVEVLVNLGDEPWDGVPPDGVVVSDTDVRLA
jgi:maltooligosyltrehalose trehalohydrolase